MALLLTDMQKVALSVTFTDAAGNPAVVDGAPVWASSDSSVLTVDSSVDGLSAVATAVGPLGQAQVSVTADADLGVGLTAIAGTLDVTVVASEAVSAGLTAGVPEPK